MNIQVCKSFSDTVPLYLPQKLFLKPVSKLNVSIQLPSSKALGKTISNWEMMERMRDMIKPDTFSSLKVVKSTSDTIRFEGEIEDRKKLSSVVACLDDRSIKLSGYPESLKLKASEVKVDFPSRHSWDSFFRDAPNMDEMKPGERPDTIHISNLPIKWFVSTRDVQDEDAKPSETIFRKVFEKFGKVRCVDIPICDPFRKQMKAHMTGISTFSFDSELYFEGYIQFSEYMGFVRAMDTFRGMKLLRQGDNGVDHAVNIVVTFDKTKHLSEATIKRRSIVRERLVARERVKEEKEKEENLKKQKKEEAERRKQDQSEREKLTHMQEREERRKTRQLAKLKERDATEINNKIAEEQKKLIKTQRKLQSIRLIEELFRRIQLKQKHTSLYNKQDHLALISQNHKDKKKELKKIERALLLESQEKNVRDRLVKKYKNAQEQELEEQRIKLRKALEGKIVLRSVLDTGKKKARTPSISSLSSASDISIEDFEPKKIKTERLTSPERMQLVSKDEDGMGRGYPPMPYGYTPYNPYMNTYNYHHPPPPFYPRGGFYPPPENNYVPRGRGFQNNRRPRGPRGSFRGGPRMPYFDGPNANQAYYKYFKKLTEGSDDRNDRESYSRSRSRSRRRSYTHSRSRSYSRSRSRSRRRSTSHHRSRYTRSRSRSRSRSRNRRTRTRSRSRSSRSRHSRRTKSRSRNRSRSKTRSRSRSRHRRSHSRHSNGKSRSKSPNNRRHSKSRRESREKQKSDSQRKHDDPNVQSPTKGPSDEAKNASTSRHRDRSKSWSLPRDSENRDKSWSKSPPKKKV